MLFSSDSISSLLFTSDASETVVILVSSEVCIIPINCGTENGITKRNAATAQRIQKYLFGIFLKMNLKANIIIIGILAEILEFKISRKIFPITFTPIEYILFYFV